jgi:sulfite exporter TauE/SafE
MPCAPLVSILIYAGLIAHNPFENLTYILVFGLGTSLSPLVLLSVLAGFIPRIILNAKEIYVKVFNFICALIMLVLGLQLIRRAF